MKRKEKTVLLKVKDQVFYRSIDSETNSCVFWTNRYELPIMSITAGGVVSKLVERDQMGMLREIKQVSPVGKLENFNGKSWAWKVRASILVLTTSGNIVSAIDELAKYFIREGFAYGKRHCK